MSLTTKLAAAAVAAAVPLALAAAPAQAGTRWTERSSGSFAEAVWLEMGPLPGVAGNAHVGFLRVEGDRNPWVFGDITDWTCPEGVLPPMFGGGHGEEPPEGTTCVMEGQRFLYNAGPVALTVDRKLATATLTGPLTVADHDGETAGQPMADITWTGVGAAATSTTYQKFTDDAGNRFTMRRTETSRQGTVSGTVGAMGFPDDADDQSFGYYGTFRTATSSVNP